MDDSRGTSARSHSGGTRTRQGGALSDQLVGTRRGCRRRLRLLNELPSFTWNFGHLEELERLVDVFVYVNDGALSPTCGLGKSVETLFANSRGLQTVGQKIHSQVRYALLDQLLCADQCTQSLTVEAIRDVAPVGGQERKLPVGVRFVANKNVMTVTRQHHNNPLAIPTFQDLDRILQRICGGFIIARDCVLNVATHALRHRHCNVIGGGCVSASNKNLFQDVFFRNGVTIYSAKTTKISVRCVVAIDYPAGAANITVATAWIDQHGSDIAVSNPRPRYLMVFINRLERIGLGRVNCF